MRESEQSQRLKTQGDLVPERKPMSGSLKPMNPNVPLMSMTPMTMSNTVNSSSFAKDLSTSFLDPLQPTSTSSFSSIPTSQTMPSLLRPTAPSMTQQLTTTMAPIRAPMNFSSTSNADLTSSLMTNINSLTPRTQPSPTGVPMNSMNSSMSTPYFGSPLSNNNSNLFQPPPPPGSTVIKGTINNVSPSNPVQAKSAAAELDDLFK